MVNLRYITATNQLVIIVLVAEQERDPLLGEPRAPDGAPDKRRLVQHPV